MRPLARAAASLVLLAALAFFTASCSHAPAVASLEPGRGPGGAPGARAKVRVTFREEPAPGVRVSWHVSASDGGAPAAAGATDAHGEGSFVIAPGKYFVAAQWRRGGDFARPLAPGDRFAWFGGNPVYLARGASAEIFLALEEVPAPPAAGPRKTEAGGVEGVVWAGGEPLAGAHVAAYLSAEEGFRGPGFAASAPTDEGGAFALDLPPGRYFLVAKKRAGGGLVGPMRKGDYFGYFPGNPVTVRAGDTVAAAIPATRLKMRNVPLYSGEYRAASFIQGRILGKDGKPRKGVYAALYENPELLDRPLFLSELSGDDGAYKLAVPVPGRYYLGARTGYGGSPAPGDLFGRYEGSADHSVTVREGDSLAGLDITVDEVW